MKLLRFECVMRKAVMCRPVTTILCLLALIFIASTVFIMVNEKVGLNKATAMIMPAFLGELGIVECQYSSTQFSILAALVVSVAFIAIVTARITNSFIEFSQRGGSVMKKVNFSDHIIIAGWNFQGERIVRELLQTETKIHRHREIVILANCELRPTKDERVEFVKGDPTQNDDLIRAGVKKADSVIVLSDMAKPSNDSDAEALMITLAVETLNRKVHTCVQIVNSLNRIHLERAHADEIICLDQLGGNLMIAAALGHGISKIINELLTFNMGSEFYRYEVKSSNQLIGKEYSNAIQILAKKGVLLIGIETSVSEELKKNLCQDILHFSESEDRVIIVNPQGPYRIQEGDALFLIAESAPRDL